MKHHRIREHTAHYTFTYWFNRSEPLVEKMSQDKLTVTI